MQTLADMLLIKDYAGEFVPCRFLIDGLFNVKNGGIS